MNRLVLFTHTTLAPQDIQDLTVPENYILYQLAGNIFHVLGNKCK
jgi:hypothetical protein